MRVNYTTYDMRRNQDSINPRTHADVMVVSPEEFDEGVEGHPFWYARVCGIFHADVKYKGPGSTQTEFKPMHFLWVRWFALLEGEKWGFKPRRLPKVAFMTPDQECAFGFLDPALVVRAAHIIPLFKYGKTKEIMGPSRLRRPEDKDEDWTVFNVM